MNRRGRASTWWLLAAVVVFTLVGAWFARNEDSERDVVLELPTIEAQNTSSLRRIDTNLGEAQLNAPTSPTENARSAVTLSAIRISGFVVDEAGIGIGGAHITSSGSDASTESAWDGSFDLRDVPVVDGGQINAVLRNFETAVIDTPRIPTADMRIVLKRIVVHGLVNGIVLHADGTPVTSALVVLGGQHAHTTDANGEFEFVIEKSIPDSDVIAALETGSRPTALLDFGATARRANWRPSPVRLTLEAQPLFIAGRVVDGDGRPLHDWTVDLVDPTVLSREHGLVLEQFAPSGYGRAPVQTFGDGTFRISGLVDREYTLRARSPRSPAHVEARGVRAGNEHVELVVPDEERSVDLSGRVIARDGRGISAAQLRLIQLNEVDPASPRFATSYQTTSIDGRFRLDGVYPRGARLWIEGEAVVPMSVELEKIDTTRALDFVAVRRCQVAFKLNEARERRWVGAFDAALRPQSILENPPPDLRCAAPRFDPDPTAKLRESTDAIALRLELHATDPGSPRGPCAVSEDATIFELYDESGHVLQKKTLRLDLERCNVIEW